MEKWRSRVHHRAKAQIRRDALLHPRSRWLYYRSWAKQPGRHLRLNGTTHESIRGSVMRAQICFFVSIAFSFVAWGAVTGSLILPELRRRGRNEALRPLLMFHSFRFVGLAFLVPGVVSPDLPAAFA